MIEMAVRQYQSIEGHQIDLHLLCISQEDVGVPAVEEDLLSTILDIERSPGSPR